MKVIREKVVVFADTIGWKLGKLFDHAIFLIKTLIYRNGGSSTSPLVGKYCGETIPKLIPSHANQIFLKFNSDLSRSSTGFMIEWDSATTGNTHVLNLPLT